MILPIMDDMVHIPNIKGIDEIILTNFENKQNSIVYDHFTKAYRDKHHKSEDLFRLEVDIPNQFDGMNCTLQSDFILTSFIQNNMLKISL